MERQLLTFRDLCDALAIGETKAKELVQAGSLTPVRIGRSIRFTAAEVRRYVERLEQEATTAGPAR